MEKTMEKFEEQLAAYRKEGKYNVLVPTVTIQEVSPFHKPVLEIVRINPDPNAGEVYQIIQGSSDFSLRATALQKISYAAGLIWNARGCQRTDDGTNPNIVSYKAEAAVRKEDGTFMLQNAEYMVDLEVIEQEMRDQYEKKSRSLTEQNKKEKKPWTEEQRKEYVEKNIRRDMLQKRKFRLQLAQTGAMDRVIRKILALKGTYKKEELEKPFIVPKIAFNPDISDPKVKDAMLRQGLDARNILFGPEEISLIEHATRREEPAIDVTPHAEEATDTTGHQETPVEEAKTPNPKIKAIEDLMAKKSYDPKKLKMPLGEFTEENLQRFMAHLDSLPDVKTEDLPFEI